MGRSLESSCFSVFFAYFTCSGFPGIEPEEPGRIRRVKERKEKDDRWNTGNKKSGRKRGLVSKPLRRVFGY